MPEDSSSDTSYYTVLIFKKGVCQAFGNNKPDTLPLFTMTIGTREEIIEEMCAVYEADREEITTDVDELLDQLRKIEALD